ncbi:hypothetical protein GCM10008910_31380 [Faecalicatena orotica]|uniref:Uncharacterized protein n=1 Tax=Faecalicatena orotica TaxID=1544 RepID=A0A2Y9BNE7_9FIRM|nr:hypothetical protein [Faecalicatena orotica]PWJ22679.1 hypothetical protein A8806_11719 [Faecalicatena orotica]SSA58121.1 hypothetical protein SAMN05216536_11719 [Faecalicatena orotica]
MALKNMYSIILQVIANALTEIEHDLIGIEHRSKDKKDSDGNILPEKEESNRFEVEIPKGNSELSKVRFSVKVLEEKLPIKAEILDDDDYQITFQNLKISYIDARRNVYFQAEGYTIVNRSTGEVVARL